MFELFMCFIALLFIVGIVDSICVSKKKHEKRKMEIEEHDAYMEEHKWKGFDESRREEKHKVDMETAQAKAELNIIQREIDLARREQELLKTQKALQDKIDHPDKYANWEIPSSKD